MTKERIIRNVKLYFEPLGWMVDPINHPVGFIIMWFTVILLPLMIGIIECMK